MFYKKINSIKILYMLTKIYNIIVKTFYVDFKNLKYGYAIFFVFFLYYLEFGKGMGGVWLRKNELNHTVFSPKGILGFLIKPFNNVFFWNPKFWDMNFYIGGYMFSNLLYKLNLIK